MRRDAWAVLLGLLMLLALAPACAQAEGGAPTWDDVMKGMDWSLSAQTYTVGKGESRVTVTRSGSDVVISGGEIADSVHFANGTIWDNDWQTQFGYHTESGSYTFRDIRLNDMIYVWAHSGENYRITLDASVRGSYGMVCELYHNARLELINNDLIRCESNYSMWISADYTAGMSVTGNGKILQGGGMYCDEEGNDVADSCPLAVYLTTEAATQEQAFERIRAFEGRVVVSHDLFDITEGYPPMRSFCMYSPNPNDVYETLNVCVPGTDRYYQLDTAYIVKRLRPGEGAMTEPLVGSASGLDTAALYRPLLLTAAKDSDSLYLRSEIMQEVSAQSIDYEIHIVNDDDAQVALSGTGALYIPYPEGMDAQSAAAYAVTIRHIKADGTAEVFSTGDGSVTCTPYGFRVEVTSLSPFRLEWTRGGAAAGLPQTGDRSRMGLYVLALAVAAAALVLLRRAGRA